jgi:hypothetical protein
MPSATSNAHAPVSAIQTLIRGAGGTVPDKSYLGLSKREAFALAALQGFCANPAYADDQTEDIAGYAVSLGDATLCKLEATTFPFAEPAP